MSEFLAWLRTDRRREEQWLESAEAAWDDASGTPYKTRWQVAVESLQEELLEAVEIGGLALAASDSQQVAEALLREAVGPDAEEYIDPRQIE